MHTIAAADEGNEIGGLKSALFHMILDRLNRVGKVERIMLALPSLHQCHEHIQTIPFGGISLGPHQSLDLLEDASVIPLRLDWCDLHVQALYSLCVGLIIL